ncbi:hypothetical protein BDZ89DRAFT_652512 [Hymenopellis radicata]|nr:hypothetical protein BDZ89DRAFT_652512 [Hymenopellis radicata]
MRVSEALTAYLGDFAHYTSEDVRSNGCWPAHCDDNLPEQVQYLNSPRIPHDSIPSEVYESGIGRSLLTRDSPAYAMGERETRQFAAAKRTAADLSLIAPFPGFDSAWAAVLLALILDRQGHFTRSAKPTGGAHVFLSSSGKRATYTPKCDFGVQRNGIMVLAGESDSGIQGEDKYRSLLASNCVMKLARVLDDARGGNLQLVNAFIRDDKQMDLSIFYFTGEPQHLKICRISCFVSSRN